MSFTPLWVVGSLNEIFNFPHVEKEADLQISERSCTCSLSKGPVLEHQSVFFLTQHRISRADPVVHPSPRTSSVSIGAVANPARPGHINLADTHPQPLGEGKTLQSRTEQWLCHQVTELPEQDQEWVFIMGSGAGAAACRRAWRQSRGGCGAPGAAGAAGSPSPPSAGQQCGGTGTSGMLGSPTCPRASPGGCPSSLALPGWSSASFSCSKREKYECSTSRRM